MEKIIRPSMSVSVPEAPIEADYFERSFSEEDSFVKAVKEFDGDATWRSVKMSETRFVAAHDVSAADFFGGEDVKAETESSLGLGIVLEPGGMAFGIRPYVFKGIKSLYRVNCDRTKDYLQEGRVSELANHLLNQVGIDDMPAKQRDKEALCLIRGKKISGMFGDFNNNWDQSTQLLCLKTKLNEFFGLHEFMDGRIAHIETTVNYKLSPSIAEERWVKQDGEAPMAVLSAYKEAWKGAGRDVSAFEEAFPFVSFATGESGFTQVTLTPLIQFKSGSHRNVAVLGLPMKVNHRGADKAVWERYVNNLSNMAAAYQNGIRGITQLCRIKIVNPYCCMTHVLKPFASSVPISEIKDCADTCAIFYPPESDAVCTAFDIYEAVCDMISRCADTVGPTKRITNMELAARMLSPDFGWKRKDIPRPAPLGSKKGDED